MELPKNITQIGEADRTCKIYIEDYVVSYMKQLSRQTEDKGVVIALYGKCTKEQTLSYFFIYGACRILSINREVRHLSQAQNQEVERLRQRYFPEYTFLGYHIFDGEMVEGMHIQEQDICRYIKGYACFYEKNDSMLAYMLDNQSKEHEPEQYGQEKYDRARARQEERRSQYEQKGQRPQKEVSAAQRQRHTAGQEPEKKQGSSAKMMRVSAAAVFAVLCLAGVAAIVGENGEGSLGDQAKQLWAQLSDPNPEESGVLQESEVAEDIPDVHNSGTLVAEDSLTGAILQENQQMTAVSGQAVTGQPQEADGQTGESQNQEDPAQQETSEAQLQEQTQEPSRDSEGQAEEQLDSGSQAGQEGQSQTAQDPGAGEEVSAQGPAISDVEAQQSQPVGYVIQAGDTLIGISTRQYGDDSHVQEICELNGISNPDNIQIGQKILLP